MESGQPGPMEAHHEKDPDFRSIVNAAAANWYSQRSISPNVSQPHSSICKCPNLHAYLPASSHAYQTTSRGEVRNPMKKGSRPTASPPLAAIPLPGRRHC